LIISFIFVIYKARRYFLYEKQYSAISLGVKIDSCKPEYVLLALFLSIGSIGLFVHRIPIEADTLLIAPFIIIVTSAALLWISRYKFILTLVIILIISIVNVWYLFYTQYFTQNITHNRITHTTRLKAIDEVIRISDNKSYTIVGKGELSDFPVFLMPYEYLLWWKNNPINKVNPEIKIEIWEQDNTITVTKLQ